MFIIAFCLLLVMMGHFYCSLLCVTIGVMNYVEVTRIRRKDALDAKLPVTYMLDYLILTTVIYGILLPLIYEKHNFVNSFGHQFVWLEILLFKRHSLIMNALILLNMLVFVFSLKKGNLRYQFSRLGWTLASIGLGFTLPLSMGSNIYKGMYWFLFPGICVICNDVFAYIFGITLGKTPLIALSPKKTVEGFVGGLAGTLVWAIIGSWLVSENPFFVCPKTDVGIIPFEQMQCEFPATFKPQKYFLPFDLSLPFLEVLYNEEMQPFLMIKPVIIHSMVIAIFASLIAPFGGFFASGVKRTFNFKDFADTIPGHGGFTDRTDCHGLMGVFVMIYLTQVVFRPEHSL